MSLLENLQKEALSALASNSNMIESMESLLEQAGGLFGLLSKFQDADLKEQVQSWISTGANLPISANQIQNALGSPIVQNMAQKLGVNPDTAAQMISEYLPKLVDMITPNGQMPQAGGNPLSDLAGKLKGFFN